MCCAGCRTFAAETVVPLPLRTAAVPRSFCTLSLQRTERSFCPVVFKPRTASVTSLSWVTC